MFNFFKEKIIFENVIPGIDKIMPMIPAKEYKHVWHQKALDEFSKIRKQPNYGMEKMVHTVRCPGIFTLQRHGWISRTWQDITIETNGDGENFVWTTPLDQRQFGQGEYVQSHPKQQLQIYMDNWKNDTLKTVVKISTGWRCIVPKGYYLLEMPVPYLDENRFTTLPGYFDRDQGPAQMNVQLLWHVMKGKTLIKAGTPIAQYVLVPKKQFEMEVRSVHSSNIHQVFEMVNNSKFVKNYNEIKKLFRKIS